MPSMLSARTRTYPEDDKTLAWMQQARIEALRSFAEWLETKADKARAYPGGDEVHAHGRAAAYQNAAHEAWHEHRKALECLEDHQGRNAGKRLQGWPDLAERPLDAPNPLLGGTLRQFYAILSQGAVLDAEKDDDSYTLTWETEQTIGNPILGDADPDRRTIRRALTLTFVRDTVIVVVSPSDPSHRPRSIKLANLLAAAREGDLRYGGHPTPWCQPGDVKVGRQWLLKFEDKDVADVVFDSEREAHEAFEKAEAGGWNCYLFETCKRERSAPPEMTTCSA